MIPRFSIITPCFNAEKYIQETIESVVNQSVFLSKEAILEYIIVDGSSTDRTVEICNLMIQTYKHINNITIQVISENDSGMYDALAKGLRLVTGDIVSYINAGDYYNKYAFDIVLELFTTKQVEWLTGCRVNYNDKSQVVYSHLPYRYRSSLFSCGFYGFQLPHLQQESTFWSSSLNKLVDLDFLSKFKLAGDFYLWFQFSKKCELKIVEAHLGGWRIHLGQQSENLQGYQEEMGWIARKPQFRDFMLVTLDKVLWQAPSKIKKIFNLRGLFRFDHATQDWV